MSCFPPVYNQAVDNEERRKGDSGAGDDGDAGTSHTYLEEDPDVSPLMSDGATALPRQRSDVFPQPAGSEVTADSSVEHHVLAVLHQHGVSTKSGVEDALHQVRAAASRPKYSFYPFYLVGLLEHLEEVSRLASDVKAKFYSAVLKKSGPICTTLG